MSDTRFVEQGEHEGRAAYNVTDRGRSLEPVISELALWWIHEGIDHLDVDVSRFTETSPQEAETFDTVQRLRNDVFPGVLNGVLP